MKLVIGSAQLGMNYGLFNNRRISNKEFKKIEKLVLKSKIKFIDTAISYGDSENIIGNSKLKNLNIITKIKLPPKKNILVRDWVLKEISKLPLKDSIEFKKYSSSIEPGIDFNIQVEAPGGELIKTFLSIRPDFFLL